ncbi:MAG: hypothetical protein P8173_15455, partial [Gammaproteobacteria bacterium]
SKHRALYHIANYDGIDDWSEMSDDVLLPYISMIHDMANRKAENILLELGLRGVKLPIPDNIAKALEANTTSPAKPTEPMASTE